MEWRAVGVAEEGLRGGGGIFRRPPLGRDGSSKLTLRSEPDQAPVSVNLDLVCRE